MTVEPLPDDHGVRVLRATGELDVTIVPPMLAGVPSMVSGARAVVLDLTEVTFFDSSGVRLVDRLSRESGKDGAAFRVAAPPGGPARRVLELVGMAELLADDDVATAMARVRG